MGNKNSKISFPPVPIKIKDVTLPSKKIYIKPPKPINKKDLRTSIGYLHDVISIIPPLKLLTIGFTRLAVIICFVTCLLSVLLLFEDLFVEIILKV